MEDILLPLIPITLFLCVTAVILLRPMSKRLAELMFELQQQRNGVVKPAQDVERLTAAVEALTTRLERVEQKQDFTDRLLQK